MWYIRKIMGISWTKKKSNKGVKEMVKIPTKNHQKKRQLQFCEHINRADEL